MISSSEKIVGLSEMAINIKNHSWENTALGSISEWDAHLIVHTNMILSCPFPMMIWWGSDLVQMHNDACKHLINTPQNKIKRSLGQKADEFWSDAWDIILEKLQKLKNDSLGVFEEDQLIPIYRGNCLEHVYWTFSYSNLLDSQGKNAGVLIIFKETSKSNTELRQKRERENFLLKLTDQLTGLRELHDIYTISSTSILQHFSFYGAGFIKTGDQTNDFDSINTVSDDENTLYKADLGLLLLKALDKRKITHPEASNLLVMDGYSIKLEKINSSEDEDIHTYFYAVAADSYDWSQYKLDTICDACKRIADLSAIAEFQKKLIISESRYRSLFENILDAFMVIDFIFDSEGNPVNYTFITTNPAFEIQSGLRDVAGKTILEIMPDVEQEWISAYGSVAITGNPITFNQYNEGTKRHYEVFASSVKEYPSQVVVVFRDVTEKKREVERKKKFLNLASHELKTPLTSIYGYLQIVQKLYKSKKYDRAESILEKSVTYVNRMHTMINGFLHLSKIEDSIEPFQRETFNITDLVKDCCKEAVSYYSTHRIHFLNSDCHFISADRKRILMVLQNLITNAVQYSPKDTAILISCACSDTEVTISIEDEGMGIADYEKKNIFKKFYRIEDNPVTGVSGFGLGLYICAEIIRQHNSEIMVKSKPGNGTIFCFTLPLQQNN